MHGAIGVFSGMWRWCCAQLPLGISWVVWCGIVVLYVGLVYCKSSPRGMLHCKLSLLKVLLAAAVKPLIMRFSRAA